MIDMMFIGASISGETLNDAIITYRSGIVKKHTIKISIHEKLKNRSIN